MVGLNGEIDHHLDPGIPMGAGVAKLPLDGAGNGSHPVVDCRLVPSCSPAVFPDEGHEHAIVSLQVGLELCSVGRGVDLVGREHHAYRIGLDHSSASRKNVVGGVPLVGAACLLSSFYHESENGKTL